MFSGQALSTGIMMSSFKVNTSLSTAIIGIRGNACLLYVHLQSGAKIPGDSRNKVTSGIKLAVCSKTCLYRHVQAKDHLIAINSVQKRNFLRDLNSHFCNLASELAEDIIPAGRPTDDCNAVLSSCADAPKTFISTL